MLFAAPFTLLLFVGSSLHSSGKPNPRHDSSVLWTGTQDLSVSFRRAYSDNGIAGVLDICREHNLVFTYEPKELVQAALQVPSKGMASGVLNALIGSCCVCSSEGNCPWSISGESSDITVDGNTLDSIKEEKRSAQTALRILHEYDSAGTTSHPIHTISSAENPSGSVYALTPDVVTLALTYTASFRAYPHIANKILSRAQYASIQSEQMEQLARIPTAPSLEILLDEGDFMILNKPSGMVLTADKKGISKQKSKKGLSKDSPSLEEILFENFSSTVGTNDEMSHIQLSSLNPDGSRGFVHRLDRGTSGCLVVARTNQWHAQLLTQFFLRQVEKSYIALVYTNSVSLPENGTMNHSIDGRPAISSFEVLERYPNNLVTKIRVTTKQGRKHQVRIHCSKCLKAPILLDPLYGGESVMFRLPKDSCAKRFRAQQRFCLHADSLSIHNLGIPKVEAPLPKWWSNLVVEILHLQLYTK